MKKKTPVANRIVCVFTILEAEFVHASVERRAPLTGAEERAYAKLERAIVSYRRREQRRLDSSKRLK